MTTTPVTDATQHPASELESPCAYCGETVRITVNFVGAFHVGTGSLWCADLTTVARPERDDDPVRVWAEEQAKDLTIGDRFFVTPRHAFEDTTDTRVYDVPPPAGGWILLDAEVSFDDEGALVLTVARYDGQRPGYHIRLRTTRMVLIEREDDSKFERGGGA